MVADGPSSTTAPVRKWGNKERRELHLRIRITIIINNN